LLLLRLTMYADTQVSCHIAPLVAIVGYLAYPKQLRINPTALYIGSIIHNGLLIAFSTWTFGALSQILYMDGIVFQSNYYFQNPQFDTVIFCFIYLNTMNSLIHFYYTWTVNLLFSFKNTTILEQSYVGILCIYIRWT